MRIGILSDTHVSRRAPAFLDNLAAVLRWIKLVHPDLIVHLGDGTAHGTHDPTEYELLRAALADVPCPIRWIPGNHDIGENAVTAPTASEASINAGTLSAWRRVFGADYWSYLANEWQIIGLNALLFGGDDPEEALQWQWLQGELAKSRANLGVMLHKPLFRDGPADTEQHPRYLPPAARARLWALLRTRDLRFVLCGHTHQLRQTRAEGVEVVWAPSSAYRIPDSVQEPIGRKVVGVMALELTAAGHAFAFAEPLGVKQHDIADHADLYPELKVRLARGRGRPRP